MRIAPPSVVTPSGISFGAAADHIWPSGASGTFDTALRTRFGMQLPSHEPDCARLSAPDQGVWN